MYTCKTREVPKIQERLAGSGPGQALLSVGKVGAKEPPVIQRNHSNPKTPKTFMPSDPVILLRMRMLQLPEVRGSPVKMVTKPE